MRQSSKLLFLTLIIYRWQIGMYIRKVHGHSNRRARPQHLLQLLGLDVIVLCKRPSRKSCDFYNEVWSWELVEQGSHIVTTDAFSMSAFPPNLTTLQTPQERTSVTSIHPCITFKRDIRELIKSKVKIREMGFLDFVSWSCYLVGSGVYEMIIIWQ